MNLKTLLGLRPREATAAALAAAHAEAEAALVAARVRVAELEAGRGDLLLDAGATKEAEAVEAELQEARATVGRLSAMTRAMLSRAEAAKAREAEATLEQERQQVEARAEHAAEQVAEYERLAAALLTVAGEIDAATAAVEVTNKRLRAAGRGADAIALPLQRAWPSGDAKGLVQGIILHSGRPQLSLSPSQRMTAEKFNAAVKAARAPRRAGRAA